MSASLLPQCPNLVACTCLTEMDYAYDTFENSYLKPVFFNHLKRLTWLIDSGLTSTASVRNIRTPVLEYLTLYSYEATPTVPVAVILMCHEVSATLTTFRLNVMESEDVWQYDDFYRLLTLPFHSLTTLGLQVPRPELEVVIRALTPDGDGCDTPENTHLPNLRNLSIEGSGTSDGEGEYANTLPRLLLKLLKNWRVGETSYFRFELCAGTGRKGAISSWKP